MLRRTVRIDTPCHESWDAMTGDSERRYCGVCEKHVHNLSAMNHDEAQALLTASAGEHLCVRYSAEADGALRFRDLVPKARLTRGLRRAAFAAAMLAACSQPTVDPIAGLGDVAIATLREAPVATPDGGCNVTTGPFTTFHLPAGHVLCGPADAAAVAATPIVPVVPGTVPSAFPGLAEPIVPVVPIAVRDPEPVPMMGEAVAVPERVDPFVPCDPHPTYAPPPVQPGFAPPPPPPRPGFAPPPPRYVPEAPPERMGDIAVEPPPRPEIMGGLRPYPIAPPTPPVRPVQPGFAPPPPPAQPGFAPPPPRDDDALMGSISAPVEAMGRRASK